MSAKGSAFERELCTRLSLWWTKGERQDVFWRTSNSGGRATVRGRKGKGTYGQYGDVAAIDPVGEPLLKIFTIEAKRGYKGSSLMDLIDCPMNAAKPEYLKWIDKVNHDSASANSYSWLLVVRRNKRQAIVFLNAFVASLLGFPIDHHLTNKSAVIKAEINGELISVFITQLENFFDFVRPETIMKMSETAKGNDHE